MNVCLKLLLILTLVSVIFFGGLFTTRVINNDFSIDRVKLITDMPSIKDGIFQHQQDALYVPYKIRLIIFNKSVYVYKVLRNIANFWSLNNINKVILLANIYPIILGLKELSLKRKDVFWVSVLGLFAGSVVIGLNKMVDARVATWFMLPIFGYLAFKGFSKINFKTYMFLLFFSLFLLI